MASLRSSLQRTDFVKSLLFNPLGFTINESGPPYVKTCQMLSQDQITLEITTSGQGLYEVTEPIQSWVNQTGLERGQLTIFVRHTSASLTIQENADPDVRFDLETFFGQLVQENPSLYRHTCEGPDDMPAHIKSALTDVSLTIPVSSGRAVLGTWQGIYLFEHRRAPHHRKVTLHLIGE